MLKQLNTEALRELIEGGSAPFKQTHRSYILWCPRCNRQKLYVEKTTGASKCFRCGDHKGWANWILAEIYSKSPDELDELLYGIVSFGTTLNPDVLHLPDFWGEEGVEDSLLPTEPTFPPALSPDLDWVEITDPSAAAGAAYLEKRGIPLSVAIQYGIGFKPSEQRVLFPIVVEGLLRGWQGRYIHATEIVGDGRIHRIPKVMTTGKVGKDCFMFQDRLIGAQHCVLVEGPVDAIKCHSVGGNVASMGKDVSTRQLDLIVRSQVKKLYVGLDRDAAKEVARIVTTLYGTLELFRLLPPAHRNDLGDCTFEEVEYQFANAEPMGPSHVHQIHVPMPNLWS